MGAPDARPRRVFRRLRPSQPCIVPQACSAYWGLQAWYGGLAVQLIGGCCQCAFLPCWCASYVCPAGVHYIAKPLRQLQPLRYYTTTTTTPRGSYKATATTPRKSFTIKWTCNLGIINDRMRDQVSVCVISQLLPRHQPLVGRC